MRDQWLLALCALMIAAGGLALKNEHKHASTPRYAMESVR